MQIDEPYTPSDEPAPGGPSVQPILHSNHPPRPNVTQVNTITPSTDTYQTQTPQQQQTVHVGMDDTTPYARTADKATFGKSRT